MMSDQQKEAMAVLAEIWALSPDVRLGQLFAHLGFLGEAHLDRSLGYIDDDELLSVLYKHRAELLARQQTGGAQSASQCTKMPESAAAAELTSSPPQHH